MLSPQDKTTLRIAAYGAVSLIAAAGAADSPHKIAATGAVTLASSTGLVGHVLADKSKDIKLEAKSAAALADQTLPALTASMVLLKQQVPEEADNFRKSVLIAVEAAAQVRHGGDDPQDHRRPRRRLTADFPRSEMRKIMKTPLATTMLTAALLAGAATPAMATSEDRPELQQAIQAFVDAGFLGMQMRVNDERGEWVGSAGRSKLDSHRKPPTDGVFRAGSVTKNVIATMVLQLVDEGKIGLDKPVDDYLPTFKLDRRITVRMILQHTSGLWSYTGEFRADGSVEPGIPAGGKVWVDNQFKTYQPEELVRFGLSKPARFEPGTGWSYSNTNYTLAQLLIEKVTSNSIAEETKRRILRPLKLRHMVLPGTTNLPGLHAHGYYRYEAAPKQWKVIDVSRQNPSIQAGNGDIISTTQDLHRFFSALNSGKLISAELLAEMRETHPGSAHPVFGSYGLGLYVKNLGPGCGTVVSHNGNATGGYAALMYSTPDGSKTLTASITNGDTEPDVVNAFPKAMDNLLKQVFCARAR